MGYIKLTSSIHRLRDLLTDINLITADVESNTASSLSSAAASASFASLPKLTGLSAGHEPSEPSVDGKKMKYFL